MHAQALDPSLPPGFNPKKPINIGSADFLENKFAYYDYLREHMPVAKARITVMNVRVLSRYEDCLALTKDPRFLRNRSTVTGGGRLPFPMPKSLAILANSMIIQDDPEHRRIRSLVQKAFAPKSLASMTQRVESITHELMDKALAAGGMDMQKDYALQIPTTVIAEMVGVSVDEMPRLQQSLRVLSEGLTGWGMLRTFAWDLRRITDYMRELVANKRANPADDILSALIAAEEEGDQLSEDEIISTLFLLIIAGYETTVHLIANGVLTLLDHPDEMERLRAQPELMGSAVEELLRFSTPIHGTKMNYANEDLEIAGEPIKKGDVVIPLLASANRDHRVFADPDRFNITRDPNRHLSFSQGNHFCLGAFLARMEAKVALNTLLARSSEIKLAIPKSELKIQRMPLWHRHNDYPITLTK